MEARGNEIKKKLKSNSGKNEKKNNLKIYN